MTVVTISWKMWSDEEIDGIEECKSFPSASPRAEDRIMQHRALELKVEFEAVCRRLDDVMQIRYVELGPNYVSPETRQWAAWAVQAACEKLGLRLVPTVRWFAEESPERVEYRRRWGEADHKDDVTFKVSAGQPINGRTQVLSPDIWVRAGRTHREAVRTIAHECHHKTLPIGGDCEEADAERAAEAFAEQFTRWAFRGLGEGV